MTAANQRGAKDWLNDIVEWGERVADYVGDMGFEEFLADRKTRDAVTKCLEAIGEAAIRVLRLDPGFELRHPDIYLRAAYLARNRTVHGYHSMDTAALWRSATVSCPDLVAKVRHVVDELP